MPEECCARSRLVGKPGGLIDPAKLKESGGNVAYDGNRDTQNSHRDTPGTPQVQGWDTGGTSVQNAAKPSNYEASEAMDRKNNENTPLGGSANAA